MYGSGGDKWQVRYLGPDRRERAKSFRRKVDADRFAASVETEMARGEWTDPRLGKTTFGEWAARVEESRVDRRPSTRARDESVMRSLVLPTFGSRSLGEIQPIDVRAWIANLVASSKAPTTIRKAYQLLSGVLEQAVTSGYIPRSPCRSIDLPRLEATEMRFLALDDVERLAGERGVRSTRRPRLATRP